MGIQNMFPVLFVFLRSAWLFVQNGRSYLVRCHKMDAPFIAKGGLGEVVEIFFSSTAFPFCQINTLQRNENAAGRATRSVFQQPCLWTRCSSFQIKPSERKEQHPQDRKKQNKQVYKYTSIKHKLQETSNDVQTSLGNKGRRSANTACFFYANRTRGKKSEAAM